MPEKSLSSDEILSIVEEHNLSVRRIPSGDRVSIYTLSPRESKKYEEGTLFLAENESVLTYTVAEAYPKMTPRMVESHIKKFFPDNKVYRLKKVEAYKDGGYYMVKRVDNTDSSVQWDKRKDNLAPTLEQSILKYLGKGK